MNAQLAPPVAGRSHPGAGLRPVLGEPALRPLGAARLAFGLVFLLRTTPLLAPLEPGFLRGTTGWLGWPDAGWHVPAAGLALPAGVVMALVIARTVGALGLCLGVAPRASGLIAGVSGYLVLAQDAFGYLHHLHLLYLGAIVFALVDADAALALRLRPARAAASSLALVRVFGASIYAWAAVGKLASEWGSGVPLRMFHAAGQLHHVDGLLSHAGLVEIAVVVGEFALAAGLLWPRSRRLALGCAFAMHVGFEVVGRVDSIGWQMCALLLVFTRSAPPRPDTPPATAHTSRR